MAALLVGLAVMAVLMSVALPVWRHEAQREKEAELVFRGQQYIRAIRLFQMKTGTLPTSVDLLVQGHYLRRKYKDPITNDDFELLGGGGVPGQIGPGQTGQPGQPLGGNTPGRGGTPTQGGRGPTGGSTVGQSPTTSISTSGTAPAGTVPGGMMGVRSKSKGESIRLYLGRNHYNEWAFLYAQGPAGAGRGQPGGPGGGRGQPGGPGGGPGGGRGGGPGGGPGRGGVGGPGRAGPPVIGPGRGRQEF